MMVAEPPSNISNEVVVAGGVLVIGAWLVSKLINEFAMSIKLPEPMRPQVIHFGTSLRGHMVLGRWLTKNVLLSVRTNVLTTSLQICYRVSLPMY